MYHRRTSVKGPSAPTQIYQQPPRLLIMHIALPSWADICSNLCEALQNFFSLACSLMGPSRMSLFSLYMVRNQHECVLPFVVSITMFVNSILKANMKFLEQIAWLLLLTAIIGPISHTQYPTGNAMRANCHLAHGAFILQKRNPKINMGVKIGHILPPSTPERGRETLAFIVLWNVSS